MQDAYMIRNDGEVISVRVHPYIIPEDLLLSMEKGEWFFTYTKNLGTKKLYIEFIAWVIRYQLKVDYEFEKYITKIFDTNFYGISDDFIKENLNDLVEACETVKPNSIALELFMRETNQEFLRVRYGGKFETNNAVREVYFRVSSTRFNWFKYIWAFVYEHRTQIDFVTIVRDEVATKENFAYSGSSGEYLHMPVDTFITEKGTPVIEWKSCSISVVRHLEMGGTISGILNLPINNEQAWKTYLKLEAYENRSPKFYDPFDSVMSEILDGGSVRETISKYVSCEN